MARLTVRVHPNARRTAWAGWHDDLPKVELTAAPVDGAANDELIVAMAKWLGVTRREVRLVGGAAARIKRLEVDGIDEVELLTRVSTLNPRPAR